MATSITRTTLTTTLTDQTDFTQTQTQAIGNALSVLRRLALCQTDIRNSFHGALGNG